MFGDKLLEIRQSMGFSSALSFYQSLEQRSSLEFNYAYYKKMENGEKLPSVKIVHQMMGLLPQSYGESLILSYCQQQFPKHDHLFKEKSSFKSPKKKDKPSAISKKVKASTHIGQQELTERQIATIASTPEHFYLFSLMTLSRRPLEHQELLEFFNEQVLFNIVKDLEQVKLAYAEGQEYMASYPEYSYPRATTESLKKIFLKLDEYESTKLQFFKLSKRTRGHFFRRISPRYLELMLNSIELLYQTMRMSDDLDAKQNEMVCSLSVRLDAGELPG
jgi:transcriptional regulator with XRE-family HTH domain